jgi:hypothetical protein
MSAVEALPDHSEVHAALAAFWRDALVMEPTREGLAPHEETAAS